MLCVVDLGSQGWQEQLCFVCSVLGDKTRPEIWFGSAAAAAEKANDAQSVGFLGIEYNKWTIINK